MSEITKIIRYAELPDPKYQELFKYTDGSTVLGIVNYENGDVYMGELDPTAAFDEKRDRRRHGYGKLLSKGAVTESLWNTGVTVGHTLKISKTGKRSYEIRSESLKMRTILYQYYLTEDNHYAGDKFNNACESHFYRPTVLETCDRYALRENLFNGTTIPETDAPKAAPAPKKKAVEKAAPKKEEKKAAPKAEETPVPEDLKVLAARAEAKGDTENAIKLYFEAAMYADPEAAKAYARLAAPGLYESVDQAYALRSGEKLGEAQVKLYKLDKNLFGKVTVRRFDGTGMKLLEKVGYGDSPYADRLKAACFWPDSRDRIRYLTLAADRGDYIAMDELLDYYTKSATRDFDKKLYTSAEALEKLWHNVFVLFASAELQHPWFTHDNLWLIYDRLSPKLGPDAHMDMTMRALAKALTVLIDKDVLPAKDGEQKVPLEDATKVRLHRWLSYLLANCKPENTQDLGRYHLAFMYYEGYGCSVDRVYAEKLLTEPVSLGWTETSAAEQLDSWNSMTGPAAYILAERRMRETGLDEETKRLFKTAMEGNPESFRWKAKQRLDLFIEDPGKRFQTAFNYYQAGEYEQAAILWRSLADQGDASACKNVYLLYADHLKTDDAPQLERYYKKKGADLGDLQCCRAYGNLLRKEGQYEEAYRYYEKATDITDDRDRLNSRGNSYLAMAELLADGLVSKAFPVEHSCYYAARARELGVEFSRTFPEEGADWSIAAAFVHATPEFKAFALKRAVNQGDPSSCLEMAIRYYRGDGVERDLAQAEALLEDLPVSTRRAYYLMCIQMAKVEALYMDKSKDLWERALQEWAQTYHNFWSLLQHDPKLQDREDMRPLMEGMGILLETDFDDASSIYSSMERCLVKYRERPCPQLFNLVLRLEQTMLSQAESEDLNSEITRMQIDLFKDGVERGFTHAVVSAEDIFSDITMEAALYHCQCPRDDNEGLARQVFLLNYVSDLEIGWLIKGKVYGGIYIDGRKPLSVESARKYYNRVIQKGSLMVADGYFYLGLLELHTENYTSATDYIKKAARMGHELAQATCKSQGVTW